ncbi:hypothetical protein LOAG_01016 [Loa loa]|uniref:Uncharacterized protein n=1 Tax=Loa loa TaxID=7209 RepID=A0A1I7VUR5_LOALO|nr:hypothetical protein LOAG_01016 [Loa loa]EFO27468.1 hypothetical protein LOAG_01016 [Loa loa]
MSFFSRDTFDRSISKSREKERRSTISHARSSAPFSTDSEVEQTKKNKLLEQHQDMEIPIHEESEVAKVARQETLEYCRDKLIIKPKKMPHDQKQRKISEGVTKQRSDYPTMEDICSDWESYDEAEQMTKQPETKACHELTKPLLLQQQNQKQKEQSQLQQQQPLQYHQSVYYNQHYQTIQNHGKIQQRQLPKKSHLVSHKNESIRKHQSKMMSNPCLKPNK